MIIGITGPSGSGKTTVSAMLLDKGYEVIDADKVAKEIKPQYISKIIDIFGDEVVTDGKFDNRKLAIIVFNDSEAKRKLNDLMFPPIIAKLKEMVRGKSGFVFIDIPVLFGSGAEALFDAVFLVTANRCERLQRLIEGRGIAKEIAEKQVDSITITYLNLSMCDLVLKSDNFDLTKMERAIDKWIEDKKAGA